MKHILINVGQDPALVDAACAALVALGYEKSTTTTDSVKSAQKIEAQSVLGYNYGRHSGRISYSATEWFNTRGDSDEYHGLPVVPFAPKTFPVGDYTGTIDRENKRISVGCQTFPFSVVKELADAIKGRPAQWTPMSEAKSVLGSLGSGIRVTALLVSGDAVKVTGYKVWKDAHDGTGLYEGFRL